MGKSDIPSDYFEAAREKSKREDEEKEDIERQQEDNKVLFRRMANLGYQEAIRMMDSIDNPKVLATIHEKALAHLDFMEDMGKIVHRLKIKEIQKLPIVQSWMQEEREEREREEQKETVIKVLGVKFDLVSKDTKEYIQGIDDQNIIDKLFEKATKVESMDEFDEYLKKVMQ